MCEFLKTQIDYVFFFHGLSFMLMAVPCLTWARSRDSRLQWIWLGLFGVTRGLCEWAALAVIDSGLASSYHIVQLCLWTVSFICMAEFGPKG